MTTNHIWTPAGGAVPVLCRRAATLCSSSGLLIGRGRFYQRISARCSSRWGALRAGESTGRLTRPDRCLLRTLLVARTVRSALADRPTRSAGAAAAAGGGRRQVRRLPRGLGVYTGQRRFRFSQLRPSGGNAEAQTGTPGDTGPRGCSLYNLFDS